MQKPRLSFWQIWNMSFGFFGIQFGWGLQMANMSAIYSYLGANADSLAILWLAAPVTGVIIQPLVGQSSDRLWTRLGRRRPFILGGAILASVALVLMPNSPSVWMAAGLLWVLDGTINASMQPFRALVADNLPEEQNAQGYAIQSLFIGLGGTVASGLPWMMTNWFGLAADPAGTNHIPHSVRLSFYIGAAAFLGAVLWTVIKTSEYPPSDRELAALRARKFDWTLGLAEIFGLVFHLPRRMWELGLVQFFTWIGMFSMWVYFSPAVAKNIFHAAPGSPKMEAAVAWSGFCFAAYNAVCFIFSFVLLWATKYTGPKLMHFLCLAAGALGLATVPLAADKYHLLITMTAVGIAWASILSMPYAMLAPALPKEKIGVMMGLFNLFIVLPQITASTLLGLALKYFLHDEPVNAVVLGGASMSLAALLTLLVVTFEKTGAQPQSVGGAGGH
ncbi:MAG: MFS transporter [Verrucomicrobiota bacterium]|nr:MFS transporter [Verrucomicrobiota bacterium]